MNKVLFKEFKNTYSGDKWGNCMAWAFALCDYLYERGLCPEYWEFQQSPMGSNEEDFQYEQISALVENGDITVNDILNFSKVLYRYHNILISQDKDY